MRSQSVEWAATMAVSHDAPHWRASTLIDRRSYRRDAGGHDGSLRRRAGRGRRRRVTRDGVPQKVLQPAPAAVGLPASTPERTRDDGTLVPSVKGVRLHDYGDLRVVPTFGERCCR